MKRWTERRRFAAEAHIRGIFDQFEPPLLPGGTSEVPEICLTGMWDPSRRNPQRHIYLHVMILLEGAIQAAEMKVTRVDLLRHGNLKDLMTDIEARYVPVLRAWYDDFCAAPSGYVLTELEPLPLEMSTDVGPHDGQDYWSMLLVDDFHGRSVD